jgi:hypothetical protein
MTPLSAVAESGVCIAMNLLYAPFTKVEETPDGLIVEGIATTESVDTENEVVDYDSVKAMLPDYTQWGNIRAMHQPIAAGKALVITPDDEARTVYLRALVVDDDSIKKTRAGVYKGFSIGGKADPKIVKRADGSTYTRRLVTLLSEISLVDRPANPDARFTVLKMEASMPKEEPLEQQPPAALDADTIAAIKKLAGHVATTSLAKASADPAKIVAMIQAARNDLELAGDMDGASLMTQAIALIQQASGEANTPEEEPVEPPAEGESDPAMLAAAAKAKTLRKAGRTFSANNLSAMENTVKTLLGMMAAAGSTKAQKAISAMADEGDDTTMAAAIGAEFTKAMTPIAQAVLNVNDRLLRIEAQPAPGGPVLRSVEKLISGQKPANGEKPQPSMLVKAQLDNLHHLSRNAATIGMRQEYQQQYEALRAQYQ